jgi:hypothetical protein
MGWSADGIVCSGGITVIGRDDSDKTGFVRAEFVVFLLVRV